MTWLIVVTDTDEFGVLTSHDRMYRGYPCVPMDMQQGEGPRRSSGWRALRLQREECHKDECTMLSSRR